MKFLLSVHTGPAPQRNSTHSRRVWRQSKVSENLTLVEGTELATATAYAYTLARNSSYRLLGGVKRWECWSGWYKLWKGPRTALRNTSYTTWRNMLRREVTNQFKTELWIPNQDKSCWLWHYGEWCWMRQKDTVGDQTDWTSALWSMSTQVPICTRIFKCRSCCFVNTIPKIPYCKWWCLTKAKISGHMTIGFPIGHFLLVVLWNQASISNGFQDIQQRIWRNGWHDLKRTLSRSQGNSFLYKWNSHIRLPRPIGCDCEYM